MISENAYLIPTKVQQDYAQQNRYLLVAYAMEVDGDADKNDVGKQLQNINIVLLEKMNEVKTSFRDLETNLKAHTKEQVGQGHTLLKQMTMKGGPSGSFKPNEGGLEEDDDFFNVEESKSKQLNGSPSRASMRKSARMKRN